MLPNEARLRNPPKLSESRRRYSPCSYRNPAEATLYDFWPDLLADEVRRDVEDVVLRQPELQREVAQLARRVQPKEALTNS